MVRQMLRRAIQRIPNLMVVGESSRMKSTLDAPKTMNLDWLVVPLADDGKIPPQFLALAEAYPSIRVLGMSLDGSELELMNNGAERRRRLQDVSLQTLIALFQESCAD